MIDIKQSQYAHPDQTTGQHTNGPPNIFVRQDSESPWYRVVGIKNLHVVHRMVDLMGFEAFVGKHCEEVAE